MTSSQLNTNFVITQFNPSSFDKYAKRIQAWKFNSTSHFPTDMPTILIHIWYKNRAAYHHKMTFVMLHPYLGIFRSDYLTFFKMKKGNKANA